jgi:hypothetical protein
MRGGARLAFIQNLAKDLARRVLVTKQIPAFPRHLKQLPYFSVTSWVTTGKDFVFINIVGLVKMSLRICFFSLTSWDHPLFLFGPKHCQVVNCFNFNGLDFCQNLDEYR